MPGCPAGEAKPDLTDSSHPKFISMTIITSRSNTNVKAARSLHRRKEREKSALFIVEGIRHVGEAFDAGADVQSIFFAPDLLHSEYAQNLISRASRLDIPCHGTSADVFLSLSGRENPHGILAVVAQPGFTLNDLHPKKFPWGVALVSPQDPGNIGAILRTIDAVGASGLILLDESADPYHPTSVRASMGTIFWHPVVKAPFSEFSGWVQQHAYHVYGTSTHGDTDKHQVTRYNRPSVLLMGSERQGLSREQADRCEHLIRLPMMGRATSLNLAVATGVMLYEMMEKQADFSRK